MSNFSLRYYQENAVNIFIKGSCNNGIIVLPTGSGKSLVISAIAHHFYNEKILVLQPSKEILVQNYYNVYQKTSH
jgi:superfamily II DNA or RNA helicase